MIFSLKNAIIACGISRLSYEWLTPYKYKQGSTSALSQAYNCYCYYSYCYYITITVCLLSFSPPSILYVGRLISTDLMWYDIITCLN